MSRLAHGRRGATTLTLLGAALAQGQGIAHAGPPGVPLAECHDLTLAFENVSWNSYDVVVRAVVTQPGTFRLGEGHGYFGTSETAPDPAGVLMTSIATILTPDPDTDVEWVASCVGGSARAVLHVPPAPPTPPRITLSGPSTVRATSHSGAADPVRATAVDSTGRAVAVACAPAVLPVLPSRTTVTCTAKDSAGRVAQSKRVITVLGAAAQLGQLRDSLPAGKVRDLVQSTREAVELRDGPAATRRLGLVTDALRTSGFSASRVALVTADLQRVARVLGVTIPSIHKVERGESVWSVVQDALRHKTGAAPDERAVAAGVRLLLAVNPSALDRYGVLHPGYVLRMPI